MKWCKPFFTFLPSPVSGMKFCSCSLPFLYMRREIKRKGWCNCDSCCQHDHHNEKEQFLANRKNKQQLIFMLSTELEKNQLQNLSRDADLLIVQKAIQSSTTLLNGDDTGIIVLLCYHASFDSFFHPEDPSLEHQGHKRKAWSTSATTSS